MKKKTRSKSSPASTPSSANKSGRLTQPAIPKAVTSSSVTSKNARPALENAARAAESSAARWTFLTNHSHVLILISRNPDVVLRHVAIQVGITERAVQRIIADLEEAGILKRHKVGRQNHYHIIADQPLRHAIEAHRTIGELLALMDVPVE